MTIAEDGKRILHALVALGCLMYAIGSTAHPNADHDGNTQTHSVQNAIYINNYTYIGEVDQVVVGQPFRTLGRLLINDDELQLSELRSDGQLLKLHTTKQRLDVSSFPPFERAMPPAVAGMPSFTASLQTEGLPRIFVASQAKDGGVALFDRTRLANPEHPYSNFLTQFDASMIDLDVQVAEAGTYLQILPYMGKGPADFDVASPSAEIAALISEPFKLHRVGEGRHAIVDNRFVVQPRQPVLVDVLGQRFAFYAYVLEAHK